jgi:serine/threonine-protein kinase
MGEVWRARDTRLRRDVAIKVLPDTLAADPVARARFDREARAVAALSHPNILDLHDVGSEGGVSWVVTELLEGQTLKTRLEEGPLPWRRAVEIALALAEGLEAAHARGVVHRDVKPSNVFLTSDGRVKILDFGIATLDDSVGFSTGSRDLTEPQTIVGTAGYLAPEQIRRETADARSDIFSLGCVLYETVTGRRAFPGDTPPEALVATLRAEPRDPSDLVSGLPPELRRLILRCLEKRADRRFQTAADLGFALRIPFTGSGNAPPPVSETDRTAPLPARRVPVLPPRIVWLAAGVLFVAGLATWLLFLRVSARPSAGVLAVLPFSNETGDPAHEYLSEGVTVSLIDALSRTPGLTVLARATVYAGPSPRSDPRATGRSLHARAVLVGRVRRMDRELHVDAELVDVASGARLWAGRVTDREGDPLPAAADLAPRIARALRPELTAEEEKRVAGRPHDPQAWDRVLRGRFFLNKRGEGIFKALGYFQDAAVLDPGEAEAWGGLAEVHHLLAYYAYSPPAELVARQREFAGRAARLDPTLSGPHAILADTLYQIDHDWPAAEREFRVALALNPSDAVARQWYSNFLTAAGRFDEALAEIGRARSLDPLNPVIQMDVGLAIYFGGEPAAGEKEIRRAIEMEPSAALPHLWVSLPLLVQQRYDEALAELRTAREIEPSMPEAIAFSGYASALAGRAADAEAARRDLDALAKERYVGGFPFAILTLGQKKSAESLSWLEKSLADGELRLSYLGVERGFDPLRDEPRFKEVVRRLGIPKRR